MKLLLFSILNCCFLCVCAGNNNDLTTIDGITAENYPRIDGSTSTEPLNTLIACKLLDYRYQWRQLSEGNGIWKLEPNKDDIPNNFFGERIKTSQTHNAIINLINNKTDLIISARKMSIDEKDYAEEVGVSLIETPVAVDALDFLVNKDNSVNTLTIKQVQDIYLGNITNLKDVGGTDETIKPFIRNANSGSQEMMKEIVMDNTGIPNWDEAFAYEEIISTMLLVYSELAEHKNGICFTPHYYKEYIIRDDAVGADNVKTIAINDVMPNQNSIKTGAYPFVADVYASIRSDLAHNTMAYKIYEWLQTQSGQTVISESGYIPKSSTAINGVSANNINISPNPVSDGFRIIGITREAQLTLTNSVGVMLLLKTVSNGEFISIANFPKGLYIAQLCCNKTIINSKIIKN
ncbi:MAG: substrate-binding domain-containing protein [Dysgonamonadaceae bacterium]|nr:substrate-binding domain-containing protein [Dysgonamonadaceae bacterium]